MPSQSLSDSELIARLTAHPDIKARLHSLLSAIDNETGANQTYGELCGQLIPL